MAGNMAGDMTGTEECDHDWTLVNRDENRLIYKCLKCGAMRAE